MAVDNKDLTFDQLGIAYHRAVMLQAALLFQREVNLAEEADRRADTMATEIRRVLAKRMAAWGVQAVKVQREMKANNKQLQRQITAVKKRRSTAESAVKAIGYLDEIIAIAKLI